MTRAGMVFWDARAQDPAALARWTTAAADGSSASLSVENGLLRFDYDLVGPTSWAIARLDAAFTLPAHYVARIRLRGDGAGNQLQFKLVDPGGANVWWWRRPGFDPPREMAEVVLRRAALEFAWGPRSGGQPSQVGAVELAMSAGAGGKGTLWIEALRLEALDPASTRPRAVAATASSAAPGCDAASVLGEGGSWRPEATDAAPWVQLDFGMVCEWGGVVVDFADGSAAPAARLLASQDGLAWTCVAEAKAAASSRVWLRTGEGEGRFARVQFAAASVPGVRRLAVVPLEQALSPSKFMEQVARASRRGLYPRHLLGEQAFWAVVGADGDEHKGLLGEDGALEVDAERFSLEPFLWVDGALVTWADVLTSAELVDDCLPVPTVEWTAGGLALRVTAFAFGPAGSSTLAARYELRSLDGRARRVRLFAAVRPFQVNPSWQSLGMTGGVAPFPGIRRDGDRVVVEGSPTVFAVSRPGAFGACPTEDGLACLLRGEVPPHQRIDDPLGFAHGVLAWDLDVSPDAASVVALAVPLHESSPSPPHGLDEKAAAAWIDDRLAEVVAHWRARLAVVPIELPACAADFTATMKASIAWVLVNRDGPRIQPGPRCYRRSWIRDGTLTGTALAEAGFADEARAFLRWYAPFQYEDGRVPCAVDRHGVDPVPEHDSHGQLVWGVCEIVRLTGDRAFLEELWPRLCRAADAIAALRAERLTDRWQGTACYGLLPESISHEGYSSRPAHSLWDDFFAVRGLADAAWAAGELGDAARAARYAGLRDAMRTNLHTAIRRSMKEHGIDFLPGAADLGDFDPTSTAIGLDPGGEGSRLPAGALARTFEKWWEEFDARRRGVRVAEAYTAYEIRNAPALVLLGHRHRAFELLQWLIADQRPTAWRQWPEVSTRDRRAPRFLGDLPHGWIASSFVRTVRRMVAFDRLDDGALVLGAGVPEAWVRDAGGVRTRGLPTHAGPLDLTMTCDTDDRVRVTIGGALRWPRGGVVVENPLGSPIVRIVVDGEPRAVEDPQRVVLRGAAAEVILDCGQA